ncbi:MAG: peptidylprolyl isomerase [Actinomycetota bacterium]|nr:peptidylprolyl isomerase [Actinomycetota bacterium]MDH5312462.1 peptidylprolyl isomerase [Actinomycetota bacterium]
MDSRMLRLIAMPVLAASLLAACSTGPSAAATVGETDISDEQVAQEAKLFTFLAALNQQECGGPPPDGETQEAVCNRFTLSNLIQGSLIDGYATDNDISVEASQVDEIIANLDQQLTAESVDEELGKLDLTRVDLKMLANEVLLFQAVQGAVAAEELDDAQLKKIYDDEILRFTTIDALHILVDTEAEAQDVYDQVTAPGATRKTFEDLAKQVSTDTGSGANGGSLGQAVASTYVPEFAEAAVALEPGQISEPVKSEFGYHVILLVNEQVTPFDEAKTQLVQGEQGTLFNAWMRDQVETQGVDVNPKYGTFDPETLTVVAVNSTDPSATGGPADGAPGDGGEGTPAP